MTQVFSFLRFRRWTQEQKSNNFKAALQILFSVFCTLAVFAIWQVSGKSTALGIALGALLLVVAIVFDIVIRAAVFLSTSYRTHSSGRQREIDNARQEAFDAKQLANDFRTAHEYDTKKIDDAREELQHLKQLMFKKRKGKTPKISRSVKKSLSSLEDLL